MDDRLYWYWLLNVEGIEPYIITKLLDDYGNPEMVFRYCNGENITELQFNNIISARKNFSKIADDYYSLERKGISMILREDNSFPRRLIGIPEEPYGFFILGQLPDQNQTSVSVVGARRCTQHGRWVASKLGEDLARYGVNVISGMAEGIDGSAQLGALNGHGYSLAVLGCGIDICFPRSHQWLYDRLKNEGGIISEYGLGAPGLSYRFPARNRIISGLSDAVIIVEAKEKSGSLITVTRALSQGREVMAVPGRPDDPCSIACNKLLIEGAGCCTCAKDVLDYLQVSPSFKRSPAYKDGLNSINRAKTIKSIGTGSENYTLTVQESLVLSVLNGEPKHIDFIAKETGIMPSTINAILIKLQLKGFISSITNGLYQKM